MLDSKPPMQPKALAVLFLLCASALGQSRPPNLVIVFADDLGYGDPQVYNSRSRIPTPNIDALAGRGMRFTDAHSASSVCTPSRYGLLTGRYPWRSRLPAGIVNSWGGAVIDKDRLTLGKALQAKGYRTACIGKWHLGWDWPVEEGGYLSDELEGINVGRDYEPFGERVDLHARLAKVPPRGALTTTSATTCRTFRHTPSSRMTGYLATPRTACPRTRASDRGR